MICLCLKPVTFGRKARLQLFLLVPFHTHSLQQLGSHFLLFSKWLFFFFLYQGLFWHRSPHDKTFPVLSLQVKCLSLWYVMAQALASSTCFSVGQRLQIKYFARAWQQMSQPLLGICSFRFHQKDELSHWCQDMKCNLNVVIFDLKRIRSKELWKTYKTQGMPLLNSPLTDSVSAYLF